MLAQRSHDATRIVVHTILRSVAELHASPHCGGFCRVDRPRLRQTAGYVPFGYPYGAVQRTGAHLFGRDLALICERFRVKALKNPGEPGKYAPFTLQTGELIMTSKGPFEGVIVPQNIVQEKIPDYTVIRGSLVVTSMPGALSNPLVVTYDARNDPTGPDSVLYYRAAFRRDDRVYSVEDRR